MQIISYAALQQKSMADATVWAGVHWALQLLREFWLTSGSRLLDGIPKQLLILRSLHYPAALGRCSASSARALHSLLYPGCSQSSQREIEQA